jgi:Uma2 family endonuclease
MASIVLKDVAADIELITDDPEERFMTTGVSWQQYEYLLAQLADTSRYRVTYLEGVLEIMAPSRRHEVDKKNIGRLLEAYFEETRTRFWGLGSTTFRQQGKSGGT